MLEGEKVMKRLFDLKISVIKPETKYSNKNIDAILEKINDSLYFFCFLFINNKAKNYMLLQFAELGKELSNVPIQRANDGQSKRQNEILNTLRSYYTTLKGYCPDDDANTITKMNQFLVSQFVREKKECAKDERFYYEWLLKTKKFSQFYETTESLNNVNSECLNYFKIG